MLERLEKLIGQENIKKIKEAKILLVGVGGVGGFTLEALVRSGINDITIADGDVFASSNLNRQIISKNNNIGLSKVDEGIKRAKEINSNININGISKFLNEDNINTLGNFDYIIDACDDVSAKISLIKYAEDNNIKIICALGTGKRLNPAFVKLSRLDKTNNDPLAKKVREMAKKAKLSMKIPVVYSDESPLNHDKEIASSIFVPATAGIYLAYYVINDIINE